METRNSNKALLTSTNLKAIQNKTNIRLILNKNYRALEAMRHKVLEKRLPLKDAMEELNLETTPFNQIMGHYLKYQLIRSLWKLKILTE